MLRKAEDERAGLTRCSRPFSSHDLRVPTARAGLAGGRIRSLGVWAGLLLVATCGGPGWTAPVTDGVEQALKRFFEHATRAPMETSRIRAIVHLEEPAWSEEQIREEVARQLRHVGKGLPPEVMNAHAQNISNAVRAAHSGSRWLVVEETRLPGLYRLDIEDWMDREPDPRLAESEPVTSFGIRRIRNYGRQDADYETYSEDRGHVVLDLHDQPVQWKRENLFAAWHVESEAAFPLVALLADRGPEGVWRAKALLGGGMADEGVLGPHFVLDADRLRVLAGGQYGMWSLAFASPERGVWSIRLTDGSGQRNLEWACHMDETLPYLVRRVAIVRRDGTEYISERMGQRSDGFPRIWKVTRKDERGRHTVRTVHILRVTDVVDVGWALATNRAGAKSVWMRTPKGEMVPLAGVTGVVQRVAAGWDSRAPDRAEAQRRWVVTVLLLCAFGGLLGLWWLAGRKQRGVQGIDPA